MGKCRQTNNTIQWTVIYILDNFIILRLRNDELHDSPDTRLFSCTDGSFLVRFGVAKHKKNEKDCEYYGRKKDSHSGHVPNCNLYLVELLE